MIIQGNDCHICDLFDVLMKKKSHGSHGELQEPEFELIRENFSKILMKGNEI